MCSLRDASGDGVADVAVGAPWRTGKHVKDGAVRIFRSDEWSVLNSIEWNNESPESGGLLPLRSGRSMRFGHALLELPDVDGDGHSDLAVSASAGYSNFGCPSGWVAVVSGATGKGLRVLSGSSPPWNFGASLALLESTPAGGDPILLIGGPGDGRFHQHPIVDRRRLRDGEVLGRVEICLDPDPAHACAAPSFVR